MVEGLRQTFRQGRTRSLAWRQEQLYGLRQLLNHHESEITEALAHDVGKPQFEAFIAEVGHPRAELDLIRRELALWAEPESVSTPLLAHPGSSHIHKEPLGVALVIGPWNYPFALTFEPLVGALAAGNCVVVKPSEVTPRTSALFARLLPQYVDRECVAVVEGGVPETTALLRERFDHIFFTGSTAVGKVIMRAAAEHLTPVTLELGGKSPCIVDKDVNLAVTARRICWGKFYNAGQTCVAPDYLLAHEEIYKPLLDQLRATIEEFYGEDARRSSDYGRILNDKHVDRLTRLMDSGTIVAGGKVDRPDRYVAPTVLRDVAHDSPIMNEEIFGPLLPVLPVRDVNEAIHFVNDRPKPLALYLFSKDKERQRQVIDQTSSGGVTINHAWYHLLVSELPFGGVGDSGMGAYHGRATFDTFTHRKAVLTKPNGLDVPVSYPPYGELKKRMVKQFL
jgi:acyl-CoA reductase-like NAD-dependent aldehyde dehydrogenase